MSDDTLRLEYVPLETVVLWDRNPKRHDVGGIIQSIERYGFKDPPKFEPVLNGGKGGLVEGNGRAICLQMMKSDYEKEGKDPPRGIALSDDTWAVPVLFGVDAESEHVAEAYAIDHNNLTMAGGDFDGFDMARMWGGDYVGLLTGIGKLPVSVDGDTLDSLVNLYNIPTLDELEEQFGEPDPMDGWPHIRVLVSPDTLERWNAVLKRFDGENDDERVQNLLDHVT